MGTLGTVRAGCKAVSEGSAWQTISSVYIGGMERRLPYQVSDDIHRSISGDVSLGSLKLVFKEEPLSFGDRLNVGTLTRRSSFFSKLWNILGME